MPAARLPLTFARTSAWLAVGMLLYPWAHFAHCNCGHDGIASASQREAASTCCCQPPSRNESCCDGPKDIPASSCCGSTGTCHCGSDCHCGCSQKDNPQPPQTPPPASPNPLEQITWGLVAPTATIGCAALGLFSQADRNQIQQLIPVSALERCIALSRFTC